MKYRISLLSFFLIFSLSSLAQLGIVDHWEKVIDANDEWRYWVGTTAPDTNWNEKDFNDSAWAIGRGGFGYGDGDDSTIIDTTTSLYLRIEFNVKDRDAVEAAILNTDYDDAYVAYLNSFEVRRKNIGTAWDEPAYNDLADFEKEARLYQGIPLNYSILSQTQLSNYALDSGKNVLAIQVHNNLPKDDDMTAIFHLHFGINNSSNDYRHKALWFDDPPMYEESTTIPIIQINDINGNKINDSDRVQARMRITWNGKNQIHRFDEPANHYDGLVNIRYRGNSSLQFPKKSYALETQDSSGENLNISLLGMPEENDWILYAPFSDKSLLRNYITYKLGEELSEYSPRTQLCEVFKNDSYFGLYVFLEKVKRDKNRVDINKLRKSEIAGESVTGGYIIEIDWTEDHTDIWQSIHTIKYKNYNDLWFEYEYPSPEDIQAEQIDYIQQFIWDLEENLLSPDFDNPISGYNNYIDIESFVDYFILTELSKDIDSYRYSVNMYKNHIKDGNKLHMGPPWDYNFGYGNINFGSEKAWQTNGFMYDKGYNRMFWYSRLLEDPVYQDYTRCRWEYLREHSFSTDSIVGLIDNSIQEMGLAADRHHFKWSTLNRYVWPNNFVAKTYVEEIDSLKSWISHRLNWLDDSIPGVCRSSFVKPISNEKVNWTLFPNPTKDQINIALMEREEVTGIEIYNMLGQKMVAIPLSGFSSLIQISTDVFEPGTYSVVISYKDERRDSKLFVVE